MKKKSRGPYRRKTIPRGLVTTVDGLPSSPRCVAGTLDDGRRFVVAADDGLDPSVQLFLYGAAMVPAKDVS